MSGELVAGERVPPAEREAAEEVAPLARSAPTEAQGRGRRALHLVLAYGAVLGLFASGLPLCPTAAVAGFPCPACGMTRASLATLRGEVAAAFALHPLVFVALPVLALVGVLASRRYIVEGRFELPPVLGRRLGPFFVVIYVAMVALWIARFFGALGGPVPVERLFG